MLGVTHVYNAETFNIIKRCKTGQYFNITPVATAAIKMEQPG
jgi:hypothetical protein